MKRVKESPQEKRSPHGWLKNENPAGDFSKALRCGAKTRKGLPCKSPAMKNGRCRLHGGLSTGAKTPEGIERIRQAVTKHGMYSVAAKAERAYLHKLLQHCRETLGKLKKSE